MCVILLDVNFCWLGGELQILVLWGLACIWQLFALSCCAWFKKENCGTLFFLSWEFSLCFLISYCFFPPWCLGVSGIVKQKWLEGILPLLLGKIKGFSDLITKWLWIGQRKVTLAPNWWSQYEASGEPECCQKNWAYSSSSRAFI